VIFGPASIEEYTTDDPADPADGPATLYGHANAEDAIAVGASDVRFGPETFPGLTGRLVNSYSAYGGIPVVFDESGNRLPEPVDRLKPDVTGPDGVNTTFFGGDTGNDADSFPNFFGTSAAAPHIAGVAGLIRSINPEASQERISEELENTATDIVSLGVVQDATLNAVPISDAATLSGTGGVGPDRRTGAGFVSAPAVARVFGEIFNFRVDGTGEGQNGLRVRWEQLESVDIESYTLRQEYVDAIPGDDAVRTVSVSVESDLSYEQSFRDLEPGRYEYTLTYTRSDGTEGRSSTIAGTVALDQTATVSDIFPNPVTGAQTTIRVATQTQQDIEIELFDSIGRRVGQASRSLQADRPTNLQLGGSGPFQLDMLASGVYFVRLRGDDFSEVRRLVIAR
jgi:subtilisin family serine protease